MTKNVEIQKYERKELQNLVLDIYDRHKRQLNNCPIKISTRSEVLHPRKEITGALKLIKVLCGFRSIRTVLGREIEDIINGKGYKHRTDEDISKPVQGTSDKVDEGRDDNELDSNRTEETGNEDKSSVDTELQESSNGERRSDVPKTED